MPYQLDSILRVPVSRQLTEKWVSRQVNRASNIDVYRSTLTYCMDSDSCADGQMVLFRLFNPDACSSPASGPFRQCSV
jgi:hypothetical protein